MLTIKYVDQKGAESVFPAESVQFINPYPPNHPQKDGDLDEGVTVYLPDGTTVNYCFDRTGSPNYLNPNSKVYVMNEHGKTVATYTL